MNWKKLYVNNFEHKELSKKCYSDLFNFFDSSSKLRKLFMFLKWIIFFLLNETCSDLLKATMPQ